MAPQPGGQLTSTGYVPSPLSAEAASRSETVSPNARVQASHHRMNEMMSASGSDQPRTGSNGQPARSMVNRIGLADRDLPPINSPSQRTPTPISRQNSGSSSSVLPISMRPQTTVGRKQRTEGQQAQNEQISSLQSQSNVQSQLTTLQTKLDTLISRFDSYVRERDQQDELRDQELKSLKQEMADMKEKEREDGSSTDAEVRPSNAPTETQKRDISRLVKSAIQALYGQAKPSVGSDRCEGDDMRWNYLEEPTSTHNHNQSLRVIAAVVEQRESLSLPYDTNRASILEYKDATDLYWSAIKAQFAKHQSTFRKQAIKDWGTGGEDGPRAAAVANLAAKEEELQALEEEGGATVDIISLQQEIDTLREKIESNDDKYEAYLENKSNGVRSKLTAMEKLMQNRRTFTAYSSPQYEGLECCYWLPALYPVISGDETKWYRPNTKPVLSEKFMKLYNTIKDTKVVSAGSRQGGKPPSGPTFEAEESYPEGFEPRVVQMYPVPNHSFLHQAPQRWIFTSAFLEDPENEDAVRNIVPVDVPTSFEDVKQLEWYKNHPWVLQKARNEARKAKVAAAGGKKAAAGSKKASKAVAGDKRRRQGSSQPTDTDRSQSATAGPSNPHRARAAQSAQRTIKKARAAPNDTGTGSESTTYPFSPDGGTDTEGYKSPPPATTLGLDQPGLSNTTWMSGQAYAPHNPDPYSRPTATPFQYVSNHQPAQQQQQQRFHLPAQPTSNPISPEMMMQFQQWQHLQQNGGQNTQPTHNSRYQPQPPTSTLSHYATMMSTPLNGGPAQHLPFNGGGRSPLPGPQHQFINYEQCDPSTKTYSHESTGDPFFDYNNRASSSGARAPPGR